MDSEGVVKNTTKIFGHYTFPQAVKPRTVSENVSVSFFNWNEQTILQERLVFIITTTATVTSRSNKRENEEYFRYLFGMITNYAICTRDIESKTVMPLSSIQQD